jgi:hypothetical protein
MIETENNSPSATVKTEEAPANKQAILGGSKFSLIVQHPSQPKNKAALNLDVWAGNPRLVVWTRDERLTGPEDNKGKIQASMDGLALFAVLEMVKDAVASTESVRWKLETDNFERKNGDRAQEASREADVWVGRDKEGVIYISVIKPNDSRWPVIKFEFGPSDPRFIRWMTADGSPSKPQQSNLFARAWVSMMTQLLPPLMIETYRKPERPQGSGGNYQRNGGGYNRGGQGGNYQRGGGGGGYNRNGGGYSRGGGGGNYQRGGGYNRGGGYGNNNSGDYGSQKESSEQASSAGSDFKDDGIPF